MKELTIFHWASDDDYQVSRTHCLLIHWYAALLQIPWTNFTQYILALRKPWVISIENINLNTAWSPIFNTLARVWWGTHLYMSLFPYIRLLRTIIQEPYIMWSLFILHRCKIMISPGVFFTLLKNFNFLDWCAGRGEGVVKGQKIAQNKKYQ